MANTFAIAATGRAILSVLQSAYAKGGFTRKASFVLYQAGQFQDPRDFQDGLGVSLFFYNVSVDTEVRNRPTRLNPDGTRSRPALPVILNFILTPWAPTAEDQLWLLAWAMRVLDDYPILDAALLNANGATPSIFRPDETVALIPNPLALSDLALIADGLRQPCVLPSVPYLARMTHID